MFLTPQLALAARAEDDFIWAWKSSNTRQQKYLSRATYAHGTFHTSHWLDSVSSGLSTGRGECPTSWAFLNLSRHGLPEAPLQRAAKETRVGQPQLPSCPVRHKRPIIASAIATVSALETIQMTAQSLV